jgi:hypothetical protein
MFRITYTQGNGYHCNCCRHEIDKTNDVKTEQDVIQFLSIIEASKQVPLQGVEDDRQICEIRVIGEDVTSHFKADPDMVQKLMEERIRQKTIEEKEKNKKNEEREKQLLKDRKSVV